MFFSIKIYHTACFFKHKKRIFDSLRQILVSPFGRKKHLHSHGRRWTLWTAWISEIRLLIIVHFVHFCPHKSIQKLFWVSDGSCNSGLFQFSLSDFYISLPSSVINRRCPQTVLSAIGGCSVEQGLFFAPSTVRDPSSPCGTAPWQGVPPNHMHAPPQFEQLSQKMGQ